MSSPLMAALVEYFNVLCQALVNNRFKLIIYHKHLFQRLRRGSYFHCSFFVLRYIIFRKSQNVHTTVCKAKLFFSEIFFEKKYKEKKIL